LYEESSYVIKRFNKKDEHYEKNMNNLSFLFVYYSLVNTGISIISQNKINSLSKQKVYYLTKKEQKDIFKRTKPFENSASMIFRGIICLFLFLLPLISLNTLFFNYRIQTSKEIRINNLASFNLIISDKRKKFIKGQK